MLVVGGRQRIDERWKHHVDLISTDAFDSRADEARLAIAVPVVHASEPGLVPLDAVDLDVEAGHWIAEIGMNGLSVREHQQDLWFEVYPDGIERAPKFDLGV